MCNHAIEFHTFIITKYKVIYLPVPDKSEVNNSFRKNLRTYSKDDVWRCQTIKNIKKIYLYLTIYINWQVPTDFGVMIAQ